MKKIPYFDLKKQYNLIGADLEKNIIKTLRSTNYALGPEVEKFESKFSNYIGTDYCAGVNTGTSALHLALLAANIGSGDEVITVSMTFIATVMSISYTNAKPVFVDVDDKTLTMNPDLVESKINSRTKAILVVHLYGQCADMEKISKIAKKHNLFLIEDSSQAHGAKYKNDNAGSIGDFGTFSFYPGKNLGACGEGGAVTSNNKKLIEKVKSLRNWSQPRRYEHTDISYNYRMDGLQAASLNVKLKYIRKWTQLRRNIAEIYQKNIKTENCQITTETSDRFHVYHIFSIFHKESLKLKSYLNEVNIGTNNHYPIPVHLQKPYLNLGYKNNDLPITELYSKLQLSLPIYPEMKLNDVVYISKIINNFNLR